MFRFNGHRYTPEQPGPKSVDPDITNRLNSLLTNGFKILTSLAGAAGGLYVIFYPVQGLPVYVGPFAAMASIIYAARWIFGYGRGIRATHYEITEHHPEQAD